MSNFRQTLLSLLPGSLCPRAKSFKKQLRDFWNRISDRVGFPLWLAFQCLRFRSKVVIICRTGALGDVICTLPMCAELRKRHPGKPIVFVTNRDYKSMLLLSRDMDAIYGGWWAWPYSLPDNYNFLGFVEAIYNPFATNERSNNGPKIHLMDDLAASCGLTLSNPHPQLTVPPHLLESVPVKFGFAEHITGGRLIIGINCGQVWPVRMWQPGKWQRLLDLIHAEYDAAILQLGFRKGDKDEYDDLRGVQTELRMMMEKDELVAIIANCHLIISVDSGPTHIAGAVGVPLVGLYGALDPRCFLPRFSPAVGVHSNVPCLFCHHTTPKGHWQTGCPYDIRCMKELDVQPVFDAVKAMLQKHGKPTTPK